MTRIALFLTAIPLAVFLAVLLNSLLDRRLAAVNETVRRSPRSKPIGLLALLVTLTAAPTLAEEAPEISGHECDAIECSLIVDSSQVDSLWSAAPPGVVLVSQSRIPVAVEAVGDTEALDTRELVVEGTREPRRAAGESSPTTP